MFSGFKQFQENVRAFAAEYAVWAERELAGKSGAEKRAAAVRKIGSLIPAPWYLAPLKSWLIGRAVDAIVEGLNWATGWCFADAPAAAKTLSTALTVRAAAAPQAHQAADDIDARLNALYAQYGIMKEVTDVERKQEVTKSEVAVAHAQPEEPDTRWEDSIAFVLKWEGGYADHPADRGGPTNRGITAGALEAAYAQGIVGHRDVKALTLDEAKRVYRANYWDKYGWGSLPWPVCLCLLDITVNHGPAGMARIAQRACCALGKTVEVDGKFGPKTKAALAALAAARPGALAERVCYYRKDYYDRIIAANPSQKVFREGWYNRLRDLAGAAGVKSPI